MEKPSPDWSLVRRRIALWWSILAIALLWRFDTVTPGNLVYEVPRLGLLPWLEMKWTYAILHAFAVIPVLALSFDRKVHYYTQWRFMAPGIAFMAAMFIAWDAFFGMVGVWGFNPAYLSGGGLLGLPWEELLFFITVPFASLFIYECLNAYFPNDTLQSFDRPLTLGLALILLMVAGFNLDRMYTATTFILTGAYLLYHFLYVPNTYRTRFYRAFIIVLIPFLLVNGVLTGAVTQQPVVVYNPEEFLGIRIVSIPVEDAVYGFLLLFGGTYWYERRKKAVE